MFDPISCFFLRIQRLTFKNDLKLHLPGGIVKTGMGVVTVAPGGTNILDGDAVRVRLDFILKKNWP